ncbi:hypothetical protein SKAU_G00339740 [Synaphobranchus kaupii]|uniref:Uncharacterized protein n=1 Tax=Synaphobranchus kaupii TaxID=118154 RepID=A0A9Q1IH52_SYNKA|nr:hypothetical protein SKAU_G00339740 [Synaphobranchus kaupii]
MCVGGPLPVHGRGFYTATPPAVRLFPSLVNARERGTEGDGVRFSQMAFNAARRGVLPEEETERFIEAVCGAKQEAGNSLAGGTLTATAEHGLLREVKCGRRYSTK